METLKITDRNLFLQLARLLKGKYWSPNDVCELLSACVLSSVLCLILIAIGLAFGYMFIDPVLTFVVWLKTGFFIVPDTAFIWIIGGLSGAGFFLYWLFGKTSKAASNTETFKTMYAAFSNKFCVKVEVQ